MGVGKRGCGSRRARPVTEQLEGEVLFGNEPAALKRLRHDFNVGCPALELLERLVYLLLDRKAKLPGNQEIGDQYRDRGAQQYFFQSFSP